MSGRGGGGGGGRGAAAPGRGAGGGGAGGAAGGGAGDDDTSTFSAQERFFQEVEDKIDQSITHEGGGVKGRFPFDNPLVRRKCATFQRSPGTPEELFFFGGG
ncbi:unnamed protein product [Ectocarpus sp. CCAP 1310/34]|nr:unnamed protein product [Ectocarpus sp. CCAP 1310/34]